MPARKATWVKRPEITRVYQIKITLRGSKPPIWRRIQTSADVTLEELHSIIQIAMRWHNSHLHAFRVGNISYGEPAPELDLDMEDERLITLSQAAPKEKNKLIYEYDFGDSWEHEVVVEKIFPPEAGVIYPRCIKGARACPQEDSGGIWGYYDMLEALADPDHEEHDTAVEWIGEDFDPEAFDIDAVNRQLQR